MDSASSVQDLHAESSKSVNDLLVDTVLQPRLIREDDIGPAVSHMHSFTHKCQRGGRFYKSSDIIAIDFTTLMRKTTPLRHVF